MREPALAVERGHAAAAGRGDGLAVDVIDDVAAGEDALDVRDRRVGMRQADVAALVELELADVRPACSACGRWRRRVPASASSVIAFVFRLRSLSAVTPPSFVPMTSSTVESKMNSIFGLLRARSCMIFEARSSSRRWTTVTLLANLVRNVASSIAESPPPTTTISLSLKKKPSHVAQYETPKPCSAFSLGRPICMADAPGGDDHRRRIHRSAGRCVISNGCVAEIHALDLLHREDGAEALRLLAHQVHQLRPEDALGEAGIVLDVGGDGELPAGLHALEDERREVGAGEIERGRAAGRAGADDDDFVISDTFHGGRDCNGLVRESRPSP